MGRTFDLPDEHGYARIYYDDGSWFCGECNGDIRSGLGAYHHTDGTVE